MAARQKSTLRVRGTLPQLLAMEQTLWDQMTSDEIRRGSSAKYKLRLAVLKAIREIDSAVMVGNYAEDDYPDAEQRWRNAMAAMLGGAGK